MVSGAVVAVLFGVALWALVQKRRWLWIIGAILNFIPIVVFYAAYAGRPEIMLSAPGLFTKIAQVLLEIGLIYLIVMFKRK